MGDMDITLRESIDLVTEVINDVLKTGSKTVTKNSLTVMASYDATNDLMQINILHSKK